MRILFDARRLVAQPTGIGRFVEGLLTALARVDDRNEYLVLLGDKPWSPAEPRPGIETRRLSRSPSSPAALWDLGRLVRSWRADVAYFPFWLAPLRLACPSVVAIHDLVFRYHPEELSLARRTFSAFYLGQIVRRATRIHVLAQHGKHALAHTMGISPDRIDVISPGPSGFGRGAGALAQAVESKQSGPRPFMLYVGNQRPHKNLARLLHAYARALPQLQSDLVLAGAPASSRGADNRHLRELVHDLSLDERVRFVGDVDDHRLSILLRDARCVVFPSLYEGFGLPVLEAMEAGTPVACSGTTSLPEVAGDAAYLFDPLDVAAIANALASMDGSAQLRAELASRGLRRAAAFSWQATAAAWLDSIGSAATRCPQEH